MYKKDFFPFSVLLFFRIIFCHLLVFRFLGFYRYNFFSSFYSLFLKVSICLFIFLGDFQRGRDWNVNNLQRNIFVVESSGVHLRAARRSQLRFDGGSAAARKGVPWISRKPRRDSTLRANIGREDKVI